MKREFSAGGIVLRLTQDINSKSRWEVLVTRGASMRNPIDTHWKFPKGHLNQGEEAWEAAIREVKEETGVEVKVKIKIGDSKYSFIEKNGEEISKVVTFYLMEYIKGEPTPQLGEIDEVKWVALTEALQILSFPADRKLLKQALKIKNGQ